MYGQNGSDDRFPFENFMQRAYVLTGDGLRRCALGWIDARLIETYSRACAALGMRLPVDGGFMPYTGGRILPRHVGAELVTGAHLGTDERECLRLAMMRTGVFARVSTAIESPHAIWASATTELPPVLRPGSQGCYVALVQGMLLRLGHHPLAISGVFDQMTADAVRRFRSGADLPPGDTADAAVWRALVNRGSSCGHIYPRP